MKHKFALPGRQKYLHTYSYISEDIPTQNSLLVLGVAQGKYSRRNTDTYQYFR